MTIVLPDGTIQLDAIDFGRAITRGDSGVPPLTTASPFFRAMTNLVSTGQIIAWRAPDGRIKLTLPGVLPQ